MLAVEAPAQAKESGMPKEINGLPVHALAVHAAVVVIPLAALLALLFVYPRTRAWARLPMLLVAVGAVGCLFVARQSGLALRRALEDQQGGVAWDSSPAGKLVQQHSHRANQLLVILVAFAVVAVAAYAFSRRAYTGPVAAVLSVLLVLGSVAIAVQTVRVGDVGARAVWNPTGDVSYS